MDEQCKVLKAFFCDGRLTAWPVKHSKQLIVLEQLVSDFQPGVCYPEAQVNQLIRQRFEDFCLIRRSFVDLGFMRRESGVYQLNPEHRWPTFRQRFLRVADQLRAQYRSRTEVLAAGSLGSLGRGQLWQHSDLDLLLVVDQPHPAAAYQSVDGVPVHIQLLTPEWLQPGLSRARLPLLQALAGVEVWFDRSGLLRAAVAEASELLMARRGELQFIEALRAVAELHQAEKLSALGQETDAGLALANALQSLAMVQLVDQGCLPARRVSRSCELLVPAAQLLDQLPQLSPPAARAAAWAELRPRLAELAQPLLTVVAAAGPLAYPELEQHPSLRGRGLSERLLDELCTVGALVRQPVEHPVVGWEHKFALGECLPD